MKKAYVPPIVITELYELTRQTSSCTGIQINSTDTMCVLQDEDSTVGMLDFALMGGFLTPNNCSIPIPDIDEGDAFCYHTSAALVFTS